MLGVCVYRCVHTHVLVELVCVCLKVCLNMCDYQYMDVCMYMCEQRAKQRQGDGMKALEDYAQMW